MKNKIMFMILILILLQMPILVNANAAAAIAAQEHQRKADIERAQCEIPSEFEEKYDCVISYKDQYSSKNFICKNKESIYEIDSKCDGTVLSYNKMTSKEYKNKRLYTNILAILFTFIGIILLVVIGKIIVTKLPNK